MKKALVTGGSGDIGAAICRRLAGQQLHVIVHANTRGDKAEQLVTEIVRAGGSAEAVVFDITDVDQSKATIAQILDTGPVQIIINNAGIHADAPMAGMSQQSWTEVIDVSLNGFFNVTQPLLLPMIGTRWGRIVNMSSVSGVIGNRGQTNYAAAKSALHGATQSLAKELASRGITVNAVAPGVIQGSMTEANFNKDIIKSLVPMQRAGKPEDVAALVNFLCSQDASYISGQIIGINGAMI